MHFKSSWAFSFQTDRIKVSKRDTTGFLKRRTQHAATHRLRSASAASSRFSRISFVFDFQSACLLCLLLCLFHLCRHAVSLSRRSSRLFGNDTTCVAHEHDRMGFCFLWCFGFPALQAVDLTALRLTGLLHGSCLDLWFSFSFSTRVGIRADVGLASVFSFCAVLLE